MCQFREDMMGLCRIKKAIRPIPNLRIQRGFNLY
jgi:hypothetical protein